MSEETLKIIKFFITSTPIGHITKTISNLSSLVGQKIMTSPEVKEYIKVYLESHLSHVYIKGKDSESLVSELCKDEDGNYVDAIKGIKFKLGDKGEIFEEEIKEIEEKELIDLINKKLTEYLEKNYVQEVTKSNIFYDKKGNKINILISAHNFNTRNYWTGEWISKWEYYFTDKKMAGKFKVDTYYYEEGNVQLQIENSFNDQISIENKEELAENIVNIIEKHENDIQSELETVYDELSDNYIKPLRRKLPITGMKMNWGVNRGEMMIKDN